jgi:hypothetical protein
MEADHDPAVGTEDYETIVDILEANGFPDAPAPALSLALALVHVGASLAGAVEILEGIKDELSPQEAWETVRQRLIERHGDELPPTSL